MKIALYAITAFVGALVALWLSGSVLYEGRRLVLMDGVFFDVGLVGSLDFLWIYFYLLSL